MTSCWNLLKEDFNTLHTKYSFNLFTLIIYNIFHRGFRSVFCYRINSRIKVKKVSTFLMLIFSLFNNIEISRKAEIGEGLCIPHAQGIIIGKCKIGKNATIQQNVTIGANSGKSFNGKEYPDIGESIFIGAGSVIVGPITIGNNCFIGANSVVMKDIPDNKLVAGVPFKILRDVEKSYTEIMNDYHK